MGKKKIEVIITICMSIILVILVYKNIISKTSKKLSEKGVVMVSEREIRKKYGFRKEFRSRKEVLEYVDSLEWIRNPFIYVFQEEKIKGKVKGVVVEGIIWDAKDPKAIINGQIVGVGDEVDGKKVISIEKNAVYLTDGHKEERIILFQRVSLVLED